AAGEAHLVAAVPAAVAGRVGIETDGLVAQLAEQADQLRLADLQPADAVAGPLDLGELGVQARAQPGRPRRRRLRSWKCGADRRDAVERPASSEAHLIPSRAQSSEPLADFHHPLAAVLA